MKDNLIEILITSLILLLLFYSSDPVFYSDSGRYIKGNLNDPPLYPAVILIIQSIFTTLNSVIIIQTFFIGLGIVFFTNTVSKYFNLDILSKLIVAIFLFIPIVEFYNNLLTEALSYAFSLIFISFVIRLIYDFNPQNLFGIVIFAILLLLMRKQFIFLYPAILLLFLGILFLYKSKKNFFLLTISLVCIILMQFSIVSINKLIKQNLFNNKDLLNQNSGIFNFTYIDSIYISDIEDANLFKDKELNNTMKSILIDLDNRKANLKYYDGRGHFGLSFPIIINSSQFLLESLAKDKKTTVLNLKKDISIKLIKVNYKKYIKFIFKKFYDSTWLFVFLPFFMILAALINFVKLRSKISLLIFFLSSFTLANHTLVYLFGRVQPRYLIYTDFILLIFIFLIFNNYLKKKKN